MTEEEESKELNHLLKKILLKNLHLKNLHLKEEC